MEDVAYPSRPEQVRLVPGVAPVLAGLATAGIPRIVVTNQSGIARGLLTEEDYQRVAARLEQLLAEQGASLTASYHCPHHPDFGEPCECRKPGTLLFHLAAREHRLDLAASLYVGDRWRDVEPGLVLGGTALLVPSPATPPEERALAEGRRLMAGTLREAVARWLGHAPERLPTAPPVDYTPAP